MYVCMYVARVFFSVGIAIAFEKFSLLLYKVLQAVDGSEAESSSIEHLIGRLLPKNRDTKIRLLDLQGISRIGYSTGGGGGSGSGSGSGAKKWSSKALKSNGDSSSPSYDGEKVDSNGLAEYAYNDHCSCSCHNGILQCMSTN